MFLCKIIFNKKKYLIALMASFFIKKSIVTNQSGNTIQKTKDFICMNGSLHFSLNMFHVYEFLQCTSMSLYVSLCIHVLHVIDYILRMID